MSGAKSIAIVGGASKAAAIVARALAMTRMGIKGIPNIVVYEPNELGGSWSGQHGYTDGEQYLCTPPEMDFGFPYAPEAGLAGTSADPARLRRRGQAIAHTVHAELSWPTYLLRADPLTTGSLGRPTGGGTGEALSDYVLRGRPYPRHKQWYDYHRWVFEQGLEAGVFSHCRAEVAQVRWHPARRNKHWEVVRHGRTAAAERVDAVILTGTGPPKRLAVRGGAVQAPWLTDGHDFWKHTADLRALAARRPDGIRFVVIGAGGAAATILAWLAATFDHSTVKLASVSADGAFFPRGDGVAERRWMTDVEGWEEQDPEFRRRIIQRTDAGVITARLKDILDRAPLDHIVGRVDGIRLNADGSLQLFDSKGELDDLSASHIVLALGFDAWEHLRLIRRRCGGRDRELLDMLGLAPIGLQWSGLMHDQARLRDRRRQIEERISFNLEMPGFPGLHVPGLSAMRGPGFPSLGALGLLAARVLDPYVAGP